MGWGEEYEFLLFDCIKLAQQDQAYPRVAEGRKTERKRGDRFQLQRVCLWCGSLLATACSAGGRRPLTPAVLLKIIASCQQVVEMNT